MKNTIAPSSEIRMRIRWCIAAHRNHILCISESVPFVYRSLYYRAMMSIWSESGLNQQRLVEYNWSLSPIKWALVLDICMGMMTNTLVRVLDPRDRDEMKQSSDPNWSFLYSTPAIRFHYDLLLAVIPSLCKEGVVIRHSKCLIECNYYWNWYFYKKAKSTESLTTDFLFLIQWSQQSCSHSNIRSWCQLHAPLWNVYARQAFALLWIQSIHLRELLAETIPMIPRWWFKLKYVLNSLPFIRHTMWKHVHLCLWSNWHLKRMMKSFGFPFMKHLFGGFDEHPQSWLEIRQWLTHFIDLFWTQYVELVTCITIWAVRISFKP